MNYIGRFNNNVLKCGFACGIILILTFIANWDMVLMGILRSVVRMVDHSGS